MQEAEPPPVEADARPDDAPYLPAVVGDGQAPAFLTRSAPLIDSLPDRWVSYLANVVAQVEDGAPPITKADVSVFVELCATYQLDPFAKEAWLAKSKRGKLLVMVGRDGLRKIAQRNGLHVDGDVIHKNDEFTICRTPDGNRTVAHSYSNPAARGEIIGAWAECREGGPLGRPMGYFYAALGEYKPKNASEYSPWSKQTSVMILAAAERQAIRQGTPLGGLIAYGEHEAAFVRDTDAIDGDIAPEVEPEPKISEDEAQKLHGEAQAAHITDDRLALAISHETQGRGSTLADLTGPQAVKIAAWIDGKRSELKHEDAESEGAPT